MLGELEEAKEARASSEEQVQQLHKQLLRLEENAEADLARAAEEVLTPCCLPHVFGRYDLSDMIPSLCMTESSSC